jgi:hypothetical protein
MLHFLLGLALCIFIGERLVHYWRIMRERRRKRRWALLNERLNVSEMMLCEKIGREMVDQYVTAFKQLAVHDQTLFDKLYSQNDPYPWMTLEVDRLLGRLIEAKRPAPPPPLAHPPPMPRRVLPWDKLELGHRFFLGAFLTFVIIGITAAVGF